MRRLRGLLKGVYPRTYGGTMPLVLFEFIFLGLSPHIRGNHPDPEQEKVSCRVYPRTYGGTYDAAIARQVTRGLSPHIRGNRRQNRRDGIAPGSIPAHTGEPSSLFALAFLLGVYPRTYGGTSPALTLAVTLSGLSPHIRGNRSAACRCPGTRWVYPRTYGGTFTDIWGNIALLGLSPHIRGNRSQISRGASRHGSIPAHTGEPPNAC